MAIDPYRAREALDDYVSLMEGFQRGAVDAETFERRYLDLFQDDETFHPDAVFAALEDVFLAVDDFYADPALRDPGDLDEDQLHERVEAALQVLQQVLSVA